MLNQYFFGYTSNGEFGYLINILAYLKNHISSKIVTYHNHTKIDWIKLYQDVWKYIYGDVEVDIPQNRPPEWGTHLKIYMYGDPVLIHQQSSYELL